MHGFCVDWTLHCLRWLRAGVQLCLWSIHSLCLGLLAKTVLFCSTMLTTSHQRNIPLPPSRTDLRLIFASEDVAKGDTGGDTRARNTHTMRA